MLWLLSTVCLMYYCLANGKEVKCHMVWGHLEFITNIDNGFCIFICCMFSVVFCWIYFILFGLMYLRKEFSVKNFDWFHQNLKRFLVKNFNWFQFENTNYNLKVGLRFELFFKCVNSIKCHGLILMNFDPILTAPIEMQP